MQYLKKGWRNSIPQDENVLTSCDPKFLKIIRTDLEKFSTASFAHQWILCSEWVPSEWVQTADKNITTIYNPFSYMLIITSQDINQCTGVVWIIVMFYQLFGLILTAPIQCRWITGKASDVIPNISRSWMDWGYFLLSNFVVYYFFKTLSTIWNVFLNTLS